MTKNETPDRPSNGQRQYQNETATFSENKTESQLDKALMLAEKGIQVFPCSKDKKPLTPNGFKDATTDENQIRKWWSQSPYALIAMPTGETTGIFVLDVDGTEGEESLKALEAKYGSLPLSRTIKTRREGGRHIYFKHTPGLGNSVKKLGPGLDTRGDGGYVIIWHPEIFMSEVAL